MSDIDKFGQIVKDAENGDAQAQFNLGQAYYSNDNDTSHFYWYLKSIAIYDRRFDEEPLPKAVYWFTKSAEQGYAPAQYALGLCYKYGDGIKKDLYKAVEWFTKATEQGHASAQYCLGVAYASGKGVEQDLIKSFEWFTLAAEQGHAVAQYNLGCAYHYDGSGIEKDKNKAIYWLSKAAEQGIEEAQKLLDKIQKNKS